MAFPMASASGSRLLRAHNHIAKHKIQSKAGDKRADFITIDALKKHFNKACVSTILGDMCPDKAVNSCDISGIVKNQLRIFSILVKLRTPQSILDLKRLKDTALPLKEGTDLLCGAVSFRDFDRVQWSYCAKQFEAPMREEFEDASILPVIEQEVLKKADGISVSRVKIHKGFDSLDQAETMNPNTYVFKTFDAESSERYEAELAAYRQLSEVGRSIQSLTKFYGTFEHKGKSTLILEYAACGNLQDYLRKFQPPRRPEDISALWHNVLDLSHALDRTHRAGVWHQDLNLNNIVVCKKPFTNIHAVIPKLADYDRSKIGEPARKTARDNYGSREYGAPECYRSNSYLQMTQLQIHQTADVWSLAAIWLTLCVWMESGWSGVEAFRQERLAEAKLVPMDEAGCFHDTAKTLGCVQSRMRAFLDTTASFSEYVASCICRDLISPMLHHDPLKRRKSEDIVKQIDRMWAEIAQGRPEDHTVPRTCLKTQREPHSYSARSSVSDEDWFLAEEEASPPGATLSERSATTGRASEATRQGHRRTSPIRRHTETPNPTPASNNLPGSSFAGGRPSSTRAGAATSSAPLLPHQMPSRVPRDSHMPRNTALTMSASTSARDSAFGAYSRRRDSAPINAAAPDETLPRYSPFPFDTNPIVASPQSEHSQTSIDHGVGNSDEVLPTLSVREATDWMHQKQRGGSAQLPFSEHLEMMLKRDHVFVLDTASRDNQHFKEMQNLVTLLSYMLDEHDENGMDLYITNQPNRRYTQGQGATRESGYLNCNATRVRNLVQAARPTPNSATNMESILSPILGKYSKLLEENTDPSQPPDPLTVYILTDGVFDQHNAELPIIQLSGLLVKLGLPRYQVGIQFISFGGNRQILARDKALSQAELAKQYSEGTIDPLVKLYLFDIMCREYNMSDIVDTEPGSGNVWKMLLGAIDERFDND